MRLQRFSEESGTGEIIYAVRIATNPLALKSKASFENALPEKVMPSRVARGYRRDERRSRSRWRLEVIGCQGRSVVGERYGARSAW